MAEYGSEWDVVDEAPFDAAAYALPDAPVLPQQPQAQNEWDVVDELPADGYEPLPTAQPAPQKEYSFFDDAILAGKAIGSGLYSAAADVFPKTVAEVYRGGDMPLHPTDWAGQTIAENTADLKAREFAPDEANRKVLFGLKAKDIQSGLSNLGYSAGSMAAGMGAGALAGSVVPGPGTAAGAIAGAVGAGAAGFATGYRAAGDQFVEDIRQRVLAADPNLTEEKWGEIKQAISGDKQLYSLWEAGPEAVGEALTMGIIKTPVGKIFKEIPFIKNGIARAAAGAAAKVGLDLPIQVGGEGITEMGQKAVAAPYTGEKAPTFGEALADVGPQTVVLTLATLGLGSLANHYTPSNINAREATQAIRDLVGDGQHKLLNDAELATAEQAAGYLLQQNPSIEARDSLQAIQAEREARAAQAQQAPPPAAEEAQTSQAQAEAQPLVGLGPFDAREPDPFIGQELPQAQQPAPAWTPPGESMDWMEEPLPGSSPVAQHIAQGGGVDLLSGKPVGYGLRATSDAPNMLTPEEQARADAIRLERETPPPALPQGQGFELVGQPQDFSQAEAASIEAAGIPAVDENAPDGPMPAADSAAFDRSDLKSEADLIRDYQAGAIQEADARGSELLKFVRGRLNGQSVANHFGSSVLEDLRGRLGPGAFSKNGVAWDVLEAEAKSQGLLSQDASLVDSLQHVLPAKRKTQEQAARGIINGQMEQDGYAAPMGDARQEPAPLPSDRMGIPEAEGLAPLNSDGTLRGDGPRYSVSSRKPTAENWQGHTIDDLKRAFPKSRIAETDTGHRVTFPKLPPLIVDRAGSIQIDPEAARRGGHSEEAIARAMRTGAKGQFNMVNGTGVIQLTEAGQSELGHEIMHFARVVALTSKQNALLNKKYYDEAVERARRTNQPVENVLEEVIAERYNSWLNKRGPDSTGMFAPILKFFRNIRQAVAPTAEGVFEKTASGQVWSQKGQQGMAGPQYALAYHGSPHRGIEQFNWEKHRGTGEGAAAYGEGTYLGGEVEVAKSYMPRDMKLEEKLQGMYSQAERRGDYTLMEVLESAMLHETPAELQARYGSEDYGKEYKAAADKVAAFIKKNAKKGQLYEVDIPEADELLDWDKPLSEQPAGVREAIQSTPYWRGLMEEQEAVNKQAGYQYMDRENSLTGEKFYHMLELSLGSAEKASQYLRDAGIPGHRYLDGMSRDKGEGSHNFVLYDDSRAKITKTFYSLADTAGAASNEVEDARSMWAEMGTESPYFKKWFGDSKVVGKDGKPLVVYHGTKSDFSEFKRNKSSRFDKGWFGDGFYLTGSVDLANGYAQREADGSLTQRPASVMPAFVNLKNPYRVDLSKLSYDDSVKFTDKFGGNKGFETWLKENGYDGVIGYRDPAIAGEGADFWEIVVFSPTQIKSATGNRGTFDAGNPDIRYSLADTAGAAPNEVEEARRMWVEMGTDSPYFQEWFGDSKVVDENGKPLVVYHQTAKTLEPGIMDGGFSTDESKARARLSDEQVPNGIFFKPDDGDIGVGAAEKADQVQIPVYLALKNPLVLRDRGAMKSFMQLRSREYYEKERELSGVDKKFSPEFDAVWNSDDTRPDEKSAALDKILSAWDTEGKSVAGEMRRLIDGVLAREGYDGVILEQDKGGMGRFTKTYIALSPTQIKSATGNRGTFDAGNPDIRYSLADTAGANANEIEDARRMWAEMGTDSPYFKRWFGASKMVDKDGKPLVVYHGSPNAFTEFKKEKIHLGGGFFFTPSKQMAKHYAERYTGKGGGNVVSVFLKVENPLDLSSKEGKRISAKIHEAVKKNGTTYAHELFAAGYDATSHFGKIGQRSKTYEIAVFSPTQIKSATGNRGTFDGANPDIRYSLPKAKEEQLAQARERLAKALKGTIIRPEDGIAADPAKIPMSKDGAVAWLRKQYQDYVDQYAPVLREAGKLSPEAKAELQNKISFLRGGGGAVETILTGKGEIFNYANADPSKTVPGSKSLAAVLEPIKGDQQMIEAFDLLLKGERHIALAKYRPEIARKDYLADRKYWLEALKDAPNPADRKLIREHLKALKTAFVRQVKGVDAAYWSKRIPEVETTLGPEKTAKVRQAMKDYRAFLGHAVLDRLAEAGTLSQEAYKAIKTAPEHEWYAPMQRQMDQIEQAQAQFVGHADVIKRLKGSLRNTLPAVESAIAYVDRSVRLVAQNNVAKAFLAVRDANPDLTQIIKEVKVDPARVSGERYIRVIEDGKKRFFEAPKEFVQALNGITSQEASLFKQIMALPAKALRFGATMSLEFPVRNFMRDQWSAMINSNYGYKPFAGALDGMLKIAFNDKLVEEWKAAGGDQAYFTSLDRAVKHVQAKELLGMQEKGLVRYFKNPKELAGAIAEGLRSVSDFAEKGTRVGLYANARKKGATPGAAATEARMSTLDFGRMGLSGRGINNIVAFWNANVQDVDILVRNLREKPGRTLAKIALGVTLPSVLLWAAQHDDDRYKSTPQWLKDTFWVIYPWWDKEAKVPMILPKPFLMGALFGSSVEHMLDYAVDKKRDGLKDAVRGVAAVGVPGFMPTIASPILEWWTNYSFFRGRAIESQAEQKLPPSMRANTQTQEVFKKLGNMLDVSPIKLENTVRGYTGNLGLSATAAVSAGIEAVDGKARPTPVAKRLTEQPGIKAVFGREPIGSNSQQVADFYDNLERASQAEAGFKVLAESGDKAALAKFRQENLPDISMAKALKETSQDLGEIRKSIAAIQKHPTMASETKRQRLDQLNTRMTKIAGQANAVYEKRKAK